MVDISPALGGSQPNLSSPWPGSSLQSLIRKKICLQFMEHVCGRKQSKESCRMCDNLRWSVECKTVLSGRISRSLRQGGNENLLIQNSRVNRKGEIDFPLCWWTGEKGRKVTKYRVPLKALVVVVNPDQNLAAPGSVSFNRMHKSYIWTHTCGTLSSNKYIQHWHTRHVQNLWTATEHCQLQQ